MATTDSRTLAAQLRADLGITGPRSKTRYGAWNTIAARCDAESPWSYSVTVAMLGIDYARRTGRLSGAVQAQLDALSDWRWCSLIADVATSCEVIGEVSRYLIDRFATQPNQ